MHVVILGLLILVGVASYFVPTIVAQTRHIKYPVTIFSMNLLFGWTIVGWIAALVWAVRHRPEPEGDPASLPLEVEDWTFEPRKWTEQTLLNQNDDWVLGAEKNIEAPRNHEL